MTLSQTASYTFRPLTEGDASLLNQLSVKHEKYRPLLGTGYQENKALANAYAKNKEIYPMASVITKNSKAVGVIVLTDAGKQSIDVSIMGLEEQAVDFNEVLEATINECRNSGVKTLFFAPYDEYSNETFDGVTVTSIGTKEFPEYQFEL